jgi:hypothetical protein
MNAAHQQVCIVRARPRPVRVTEHYTPHSLQNLLDPTAYVGAVPALTARALSMPPPTSHTAQEL